MKRVIILILAGLLISFLLNGCAEGNHETITAFCGSASKPAMEEATKVFEKKTGIRVYLNFGGSGVALSQMKLSKSGDLFIPGSPDYMEKAKIEGVVYPETEKIITYLIPAILVQKGNSKNIQTLSDLVRPGIKVGIGNLEYVCVGLYAYEIIGLELQRIHNEMKITTIHVTHNQREAEEIADRIAILNGGSLEQVGSPEEIFFSPQTESVSEFIGTPNILDCKFSRDLGHGLIEVRCGEMALVIPHFGNPVRRIAIFPRDIYISEVSPPGPRINRFKGLITGIKPDTGVVRLEVKVGEGTILWLKYPLAYFKL